MTEIPGDLIGTWRLVDWHDRDSEDDAWEQTLGDGATGLATFGPGATVSVHVSAPQPTDPDLPTYLSYFGTFTVRGGELQFALEGAHRPSLLEDDELRPFELVGDELVLGDQRTWRRRLRRA